MAGTMPERTDVCFHHFEFDMEMQRTEGNHVRLHDDVRISAAELSSRKWKIVEDVDIDIDIDI